MTFYNIFSNKPTEMKKQNSKIIVDHREKNSLVPSELSKLGFQIQFEQLKLGDYIINNHIVERKTFSDLQSSIINKRIFSQINDLVQHNSLLIIEGSSDLFIHENAMRGFLLSLAKNYKIPFVFSKDEEETAKYICLLANKDKVSNDSVRHTRSNLSNKQRKQFILEGFPGIGPKTAKKLLNEFKSLREIFNSSDEKLENILGKKAEQFRNLLD